MTTYLSALVIVTLPVPWWWSCRANLPINIKRPLLLPAQKSFHPTPLGGTSMPSRRRPLRLGRRPTAALHPTLPRPARTAPRPQRSHRPTAAKAAGLPRQFRATPEPAHVLEQCALPSCTSPPVFKNKGARYCCDLHRLQHWRMKKRALGPPAGSPTTPTRSRLTLRRGPGRRPGAGVPAGH